MLREAAVAAPILVVYAGGTFGMRDRGRGLEAPVDLRMEMDGILSAGRGSTDHGRVHPWVHAPASAIGDSSQSGHGGGLAIADLIRSASSDGHIGGAVVVHGTDTLAHVAAQTAFAIADLELPVAFTGAQKPLGTPGGDAEANLRDAFAWCARSTRGDAATVVAFGGRTLTAVRATKRSSEEPDGFHAPLARAESAVGIDESLGRALAAAAGHRAPSVGLLTAVPGMPASLVDAALAAFPDGLVLEGFGAGTFPLDDGRVPEAIRRGVEHGTPVLATTRCPAGSVGLDRYAVGAELAAAGAVGGADLTAEAAVGKLRALVRAGYAGRDLARRCAANLIGEQRSR
ncbi:asparaginase [Leucobacter tardus]|uniref:Asparaginase n=1 Tax=Leucobacter tardus TaxID=501483 RepID=A0A939QI43_9MICO|nr:asparaginase domain-containing protein [Leucobacter tardus]MBO2990488.1 asparaginase [Leucobacter tardus]